MVEKIQIERPSEWEDFAGIGPKRASQLRDELGQYSNVTKAKNALKNKLASVSSGNRRNLPKYAQNVVQGTNGTTKQRAEALDEKLVQRQSVDQRTARTRSKTTRKQRNKEADRRDRGFELMNRGAADIVATFGALRDEYDERFEVPAADLGRSIREEQDRATAQPVISAASSRVTFAGGAQAADLVDETEQAVANTSENKPVISPGEGLDKLGDFVEQEIGFDRSVGGVEFDRRDRIAASELHDERSMEAQRVDEQRAAPVTSDLEKWSSSPDEFDYPGVDTNPTFADGALFDDDATRGMDSVRERLASGRDSSNQRR
jgi:hypothetical protein